MKIKFFLCLLFILSCSKTNVDIVAKKPYLLVISVGVKNVNFIDFKVNINAISLNKKNHRLDTNAPPINLNLASVGRNEQFIILSKRISSIDLDQINLLLEFDKDSALTFIDTLNTNEIYIFPLEIDNLDSLVNDKIRYPISIKFNKNQVTQDSNSLHIHLELDINQSVELLQDDNLNFSSARFLPHITIKPKEAISRFLLCDELTMNSLQSINIKSPRFHQTIWLENLSENLQLNLEDTDFFPSQQQYYAGCIQFYNYEWLNQRLVIKNSAVSLFSNDANLFKGISLATSQEGVGLLTGNYFPKEFYHSNKLVYRSKMEVDSSFHYFWVKPQESDVMIDLMDGDKALNVDFIEQIESNLLFDTKKSLSDISFLVINLDESDLLNQFTALNKNPEFLNSIWVNLISSAGIYVPYSQLGNTVFPLLNTDKKIIKKSRLKKGQIYFGKGNIIHNENGMDILTINDTKITPLVDNHNVYLYEHNYVWDSLIERIKRSENLPDTSMTLFKSVDFKAGEHQKKAVLLDLSNTVQFVSIDGEKQQCKKIIVPFKNTQDSLGDSIFFKEISNGSKWNFEDKINQLFSLESSSSNQLISIESFHEIKALQDWLTINDKQRNKRFIESIKVNVKDAALNDDLLSIYKSSDDICDFNVQSIEVTWIEEGVYSDTYRNNFRSQAGVTLGVYLAAKLSLEIYLFRSIKSLLWPVTFYEFSQADGEQVKKIILNQFQYRSILDKNQNYKRFVEKYSGMNEKINEDDYKKLQAFITGSGNKLNNDFSVKKFSQWNLLSSKGWLDAFNPTQRLFNVDYYQYQPSVPGFSSQPVQINQSDLPKKHSTFSIRDIPFRFYNYIRR